MIQRLKPRVATIRPTLATVAPGSWRTSDMTAAQRGYGYQWQKAREGYLAKHPLCVYCQREGRVEEATILDHIKPHQGDQTLFWDRSNWQGLCKPHHDSVKQREEKAGEFEPRPLPSPKTYTVV